MLDTPESRQGSYCLHKFISIDFINYILRNLGDLPIRPDQPRRVAGHVPPTGPAVHRGRVLTLRATVRVAVRFGEVERALALPVGGADEPGHNGGGTLGSTAGFSLVRSSCVIVEGGKGYALLPVEERLVAKEPFPLAVDGIADGCIGVDRARGVVAVEAGDAPFVGPVAVACAVCHWVRLEDRKG